MATQVRTVDARSKLKPRRPPYWVTLSDGMAIGFRKMTASSEGTWLVQYYDSSTRKQVRKALGSFDDLPANQRYDAAKKEAEASFKHLSGGGRAESIAVAQACERYIAIVLENKGPVIAESTEARFKRYVYPNKIAKIKMDKLRRADVEAWVKALKASPVTKGKAEAAKRAASTVNRDMTMLRAAFNMALKNDMVITDAAWRVPLLPIKNADRRRDAYLDRAQRRALIDAAPDDVGAFLKGLALLPLRPGALAALSVSDLDKRLKTLKIGTDKAGKDRKIMVPPATLAFLLEQAKRKLPNAPLFSRADGKRWDKDAWKHPVKAAAAAVGLSDAITAYAMRHSVITDLVTGGLDLMTIAQLSGTSVAMIEKHYSHLRAAHAAEALATLAL